VRCVMCGRRLITAAVHVAAEPDAFQPHRGGPIGPVCARRAGLLGASRARKMRIAVRIAKRTPVRAVRVDESQLDWVG